MDPSPDPDRAEAPDDLYRANLLGALALAVTDRLGRLSRRHPNEALSGLAALNVIGVHGGRSNNELALALGLSHTTTVRLVDRLEAEGLVASVAGRDRRRVELSLTPAGAARLAGLMAERQQLLKRCLAPLSPRDRADFARISAQILAGFVAGSDEADRLCRLCDEQSCPDTLCPVHCALSGAACAGHDAP